MQRMFHRFALADAVANALNDALEYRIINTTDRMVTVFGKVSGTGI
jgi:hypothetical protein